MLIPIVSGVVLGTLFVTVAARRGSGGESQLLAIGLVIAALIYVALAMFHTGGAGLRYELAGLLIFGGLAWLGTRVSPLWLAFGWAAHAGWDVGLHLDLAGSTVPEWYPLLCIGFDLIVAGFVLGSITQDRMVSNKVA